MRNAYGEPIERWGDGDVALTGVASAATVGPGDSYTGVWGLYGWELATQVDARPVRSHTTDGAVFDSSLPLVPLCP